MTLEEAKQLKPGDRVLVEATIRGNEYLSPIDGDGAVRIRLENSPSICVLIASIKPEAIREKISPPRRKFRRGDIVSVPNGRFLEVEENEDVKHQLVTVKNQEKDHEFYLFSDLTLICSAKDRADKAGETRKGGEA